MRLVALDRLQTGDRLARDVHVGPSPIPLLRAGVRVSTRYVDGLRDAGVRAVYVDDELSEGIEPRQALTEKTRREATKALSTAFATVGEGRTQPPLNEATIAPLQEIAAKIVNDILGCGDALLALDDLGTLDAYTLQHSIDVTALGVLLGERHARKHGWVDWKGRRRYDKLEERLIVLGTGLLLHDIGKLAVPTDVIQKTGPLDAEEWELIREHPTIGYRMLSNSRTLSEVSKSIVRSHHERWDGGGYPSGLVGEDIAPLARLAAIADVFDAITAERPYKQAAPVHVGVDTIIEGSGRLFDPELVVTFASTVAPYPPGLSVALSDGRRGIVADVAGDAVSRPVVRIVEDGRAVGEIALAELPELEIVDVDVELDAVPV